MATRLSYSHGRDTQLALSPLTIFQQLDETARDLPDNKAYVFYGHGKAWEQNEITYSEWSERSTRLAASLHNMGLTHQDRAAVFLPDSGKSLCIQVALMRLGINLVLLNITRRFLKDPVKFAKKYNCNVLVMDLDFHADLVAYIGGVDAPSDEEEDDSDSEAPETVKKKRIKLFKEGVYWLPRRKPPTPVCSEDEEVRGHNDRELLNVRNHGLKAVIQCGNSLTRHATNYDALLLDDVTETLPTLETIQARVHSDEVALSLLGNNVVGLYPRVAQQSHHALLNNVRIYAEHVNLKPGSVLFNNRPGSSIIGIHSGLVLSCLGVTIISALPAPVSREKLLMTLLRKLDKNLCTHVVMSGTMLADIVNFNLNRKSLAETCRYALIDRKRVSAVVQGRVRQLWRTLRIVDVFMSQETLCACAAEVPRTILADYQRGLEGLDDPFGFRNLGHDFRGCREREGRSTVFYCVGRALPYTEVSVCDDEEREVGVGEVGEVRVRGYSVFRGYLDRPRCTTLVRNAITNWYYTSELGKFDEQGNLWVCGRKDAIRRTGVRVYGLEIETVLLKNCGIRDVAVVGIPDDVTGEEVVACVTANNPYLASRDVITWSQDNFSRSKEGFCSSPGLCYRYDELPRTRLGRINKYQLKRDACAKLGRPEPPPFVLPTPVSRKKSHWGLVRKVVLNDSMSRSVDDNRDSDLEEEKVKVKKKSALKKSKSVDVSTDAGSGNAATENAGSEKRSSSSGKRSFQMAAKKMIKQKKNKTRALKQVAQAYITQVKSGEAPPTEPVPDGEIGRLEANTNGTAPPTENHVTNHVTTNTRSKSCPSKHDTDVLTEAKRVSFQTPQKTSDTKRVSFSTQNGVIYDDDVTAPSMSMSMVDSVHVAMEQVRMRRRSSVTLMDIDELLEQRELAGLCTRLNQDAYSSGWGSLRACVQSCVELRRLSRQRGSRDAARVQQEQLGGGEREVGALTGEVRELGVSGRRQSAVTIDRTTRAAISGGGNN